MIDIESFSMWFYHSEAQDKNIYDGSTETQRAQSRKKIIILCLMLLHVILTSQLEWLMLLRLSLKTLSLKAKKYKNMVRNFIKARGLDYVEVK